MVMVPNFDSQEQKNEWLWDQVDEINANNAIATDLAEQMLKIDTDSLAYQILYLIYKSYADYADALEQRVRPML